MLRIFWVYWDEKGSLVTVNWEAFEAPKSIGGLGLGNIHLKNLGLLTKWW